MARKSKAKRSRKAPSALPSRGASDRDKAVDALMALLTEHSFEDIGLAEVAGRAGLKLSQLRAEFGSTLGILAAHIKDIDRAVLAGSDPEMTEESPRERLFEVLMRRLETLAPYKEAVRSLLRSARLQSRFGAGAQHHGDPLAEMDVGGRRHQRGWAEGRHARAGRGADVCPRACGLVRRRREPRPHHGRARSRASQRRALGRIPRRPVRHSGLHLARPPSAPPLSRRGRSGSGVAAVVPGRERSSRTQNPEMRTEVASGFRVRRFAPFRNDSEFTPAPAPSPASRRAGYRRA